MILVKDNTITQTLDKEINEVGNFLLFLKDKLNAKYSSSIMTYNGDGHWKMTDDVAVRYDELNDEWMKSDRFQHLSKL